MSEFVYSKKRNLVYYFQYKQVDHYKEYELKAYHLIKDQEVFKLNQKAFRDGLDGSFKILSPRSLTLSPEDKKVYFILEKYATGSILIELDIKKKTLRELFSAESFEFIQSGKFKDNLLVGVSIIKDRGRDIYYKIKSLKGETLKEFENYDDYMEYKGNLTWETK